MALRWATSLCLALFAPVAADCANAQLSPSEQRMVTSIDRDHDRDILLLERLVNINSGTLNLAGVDEVARTVRGEFTPLGFDVTWTPKSQVGRAGDLVARHPGQGHGTGRRLLLIAHLDTVFEANSPFRAFRKLPDARALGPGAGDDMGGIVVVLAALRAMRDAGTLQGADITVFLTGDEEDTGSPLSDARAGLIAAGRAADVALDFEPMIRDDQGRDMGSVGRRSAIAWTLTTQGRGGHGSQIFTPGSGDGAIYEMARILETFRTALPDPDLTYNVGLIAGGSAAGADASGNATASGKTNVIATTALARGDLRAMSDAQTAGAEAKMQGIVAHHLPGTDAKLDFAIGYPAMEPTPANRALLADLNGVNDDLGVPRMAALDPKERGAGDISFVARYVDSLAGLGAYTSGMHSAQETVDLDSLSLQAKRAAILMTRLAYKKR